MQLYEARVFLEGIVLKPNMVASDGPPERKAMPGTATGTQLFDTRTVACATSSGETRLGCLLPETSRPPPILMPSAASEGPGRSPSAMAAPCWRRGLESLDGEGKRLARRTESSRPPHQLTDIAGVDQIRKTE